MRRHHWNKFTIEGFETALEHAWIHYTRNDIAKAIEIVKKRSATIPALPWPATNWPGISIGPDATAEAIDSYESGLRLERKDTAAMTVLRDALRDGSPNWRRMAARVVCESLRADARFQSLLKKIGFPE